MLAPAHRAAARARLEDTVAAVAQSTAHSQPSAASCLRNRGASLAWKGPGGRLSLHQAATSPVRRLQPQNRDNRGAGEGGGIGTPTRHCRRVDGAGTAADALEARCTVKGGVTMRLATPLGDARPRDLNTCVRATYVHKCSCQPCSRQAKEAATLPAGLRSGESTRGGGVTAGLKS